MYQNYNCYPQPQQQNLQNLQQQNLSAYNSYLRQAPSQNGLKGRMVSSLEEVRATPIDFDGSVFYFPDLANKCIYTKQINIDGTASLYMYELRELPIEKENQVVIPSVDKFVTKDELAQVVAQLRESLSSQSAQQQPPQKEILSF